MVKKTKIVVDDGSQAAQEEGSAEVEDRETPAAEPEPSPEPLKALEEKLASAQQEASDNYDRLLRAAAEFENYKKRSLREISDIRKYANEALLRELLTVVDNLERAIASAEPGSENGRGVVDGVVLTLAELMKLLEKHQVVPIQAKGESFDPTFHQAMCQEASADHPPNTVLQEFQRGYLLHDRLLRPAMVVVSKAVEDAAPTEKSVNTKI